MILTHLSFKETEKSTSLDLTFPLGFLYLASILRGPNSLLHDSKLPFSQRFVDADRVDRDELLARWSHNGGDWSRNAMFRR